MKLTPEKWEKKMQKFRRSSTLRIFPCTPVSCGELKKVVTPVQDDRNIHCVHKCRAPVKRWILLNFTLEGLNPKNSVSLYIVYA